MSTVLRWRTTALALLGLAVGLLLATQWTRTGWVLGAMITAVAAAVVCSVLAALAEGRAAVRRALDEPGDDPDGGEPR